MATQRHVLSPTNFTSIDGTVASWNFFHVDEDDDLASRFYVFNVRPSPAQLQRHFPGGGLDAMLEATFAASGLDPQKPQLWTWVYKEGTAFDWYQVQRAEKRLGRLGAHAAKAPCAAPQQAASSPALDPPSATALLEGLGVSPLVCPCAHSSHYQAVSRPAQQVHAICFWFSCMYPPVAGGCWISCLPRWMCPGVLTWPFSSS